MALSIHSAVFNKNTKTPFENYKSKLSSYKESPSSKKLILTYLEPNWIYSCSKFLLQLLLTVKNKKKENQYAIPILRTRRNQKVTPVRLEQAQLMLENKSYLTARTFWLSHFSPPPSKISSECPQTRQIKISHRLRRCMTRFFRHPSSGSWLFWHPNFRN